METYKEHKLIFNVIALCKLMLHDKLKTSLFCLVGIVLGLSIAFGTPKFYKATVMLAPESTENMGSTLSSMASLVGLKNMMGGDDAIYPEIYPELIGSMDFLVSLFPVQVTTKDSTLTCDYYTYLRKHQKIAWYMYPKVYIIETLKKYKKDGEGKQGKDGEVNPFYLTKDQYETAKLISFNLNCNVDKRTSVISIEITDQDPYIAATLADTVKNRLQDFITDYRTKKSRNDLAYMEKLFEDAKKEYKDAQREYAEFCDANQEVVLQEVQSKRDDLENEMQLKYNIYTQIVEQLQLAKSKVQENTPAFTTLQSATVPVKHSNKPKILSLIAGAFLFYVLRVLIVMYKHRKEVFLLIEK